MERVPEIVVTRANQRQTLSGRPIDPARTMANNRAVIAAASPRFRQLAEWRSNKLESVSSPLFSLRSPIDRDLTLV